MNNVSRTAQSARESARHDDGKFGAQVRGEPSGVSLNERPYFHQLQNWAPMEMEYVPQANSLAKIVSVVDAIDEGVTSQVDLARALDMEPQQGNYYATAARYLGLIDQDESEKPFVLYATPLGIDFQNSDAETRAAMISQMIPMIPEVETIRHHGGERVLLEDFKNAGLSPETAGRRIDMLRSWSNAVQDLRELEGVLREETGETRVRCNESAEARERRLRERAEREQARLIAGRHANVVNQLCDSCFQTKSLSGECGNCD